MCWTSRKNTASALSRYANPRFITIWRATRIGIHTNPSGWRGPKMARIASSTTKLKRKLASAESTLAAGRSCSGIRTFLTSGAFARIADAPDCSDVAKNVHGSSPTKRKIAYGCSPDAVIGRVRRTTPKRIQNTTSCSSGLTKFHKKPSAEPLYRARSSRHAKSTSSSRRSTSTRRSAITVEEYLERESAQEFWPLGPEPVVNLLQKSLGLNTKLARFRSGHATSDVIHRSVPARATMLEVIGRVCPTSPAQLCKSNEGQAMVVGAVDSFSVGADEISIALVSTLNCAS